MVSGDPQNTRPKPSGKKKKQLSQKEQSSRFVAMAKELEVDESVEVFEKAVDIVIPYSPKKAK